MMFWEVPHTVILYHDYIFIWLFTSITKPINPNFFYYPYRKTFLWENLLVCIITLKFLILLTLRGTEIISILLHSVT